MVAEACQRRGVGLGFYYSLPDWHHPNYPNLGRHHEMLGPRPGDDPDEEKYLEFVANQVRELLTNYGRLGEFFWDINVAEFDAPELNRMIRELQPDALINDRGPAPGRLLHAGAPRAGGCSLHQSPPRRCSRWAARAGVTARAKTTTRTST